MQEQNWLIQPSTPQTTEHQPSRESDLKTEVSNEHFSAVQSALLALTDPQSLLNQIDQDPSKAALEDSMLISNDAQAPMQANISESQLIVLEALKSGGYQLSEHGTNISAQDKKEENVELPECVDVRSQQGLLEKDQIGASNLSGALNPNQTSIQSNRQYNIQSLNTKNLEISSRRQTIFEMINATFSKQKVALPSEIHKTPEQMLMEETKPISTEDQKIQEQEQQLNSENTHQIEVQNNQASLLSPEAKIVDEGNQNEIEDAGNQSDSPLLTSLKPFSSRNSQNIQMNYPEIILNESEAITNDEDKKNLPVNSEAEPPIQEERDAMIVPQTQLMKQNINDTIENPVNPSQNSFVQQNTSLVVNISSNQSHENIQGETQEKLLSNQDLPLDSKITNPFEKEKQENLNYQTECQPETHQIDLPLDNNMTANEVFSKTVNEPLEVIDHQIESCIEIHQEQSKNLQLINQQIQIPQSSLPQMQSQSLKTAEEIEQKKYPLVTLTFGPVDIPVPNQAPLPVPEEQKSLQTQNKNVENDPPPSFIPFQNESKIISEAVESQEGKSELLQSNEGFSTLNGAIPNYSIEVNYNEDSIEDLQGHLKTSGEANQTNFEEKQCQQDISIKVQSEIRESPDTNNINSILPGEYPNQSIQSLKREDQQNQPLVTLQSNQDLSLKEIKNVPVMKQQLSQEVCPPNIKSEGINIVNLIDQSDRLHESLNQNPAPSQMEVNQICEKQIKVNSSNLLRNQTSPEKNEIVQEQTQVEQPIDLISAISDQQLAPVQAQDVPPSIPEEIINQQRPIEQPSQQDHQQSLSNIVVHNNYNQSERPMEQLLTLEESQKRTQLPTVPPCISISINRYNEISLSIFNNNTLNQPEQRPIQPVRVEQSFNSLNNSNEVQEPQYAYERNQNLINISSSSLEDIPQGHSIQESIPEEKPEQNSSIVSRIFEEKQLQTQRIQSVENCKVYNDAPAQTSQIFEEPISKTIVEEQTQPSSEQMSRQNILEAYKYILSIADSYLMKEQPNESDIKDFENLLRPHVAEKLMTQPTSQIGKCLFKNGLILTAIVKLFTKQSKTPFLANHLFEYLDSAFKLEENHYIFYDTAKRAKEEFTKYLEEQYLQQYIKARKTIEEQEKPIIRSKLSSISEEEIKAQEKKNKNKNQNLSLNSNFLNINQVVSKPHEQVQNQPEQDRFSTSNMQNEVKHIIPKEDRSHDIKNTKVEQVEKIKDPLNNEKVNDSQSQASEKQVLQIPNKKISKDSPEIHSKEKESSKKLQSEKRVEESNKKGEEIKSANKDMKTDVKTSINTSGESKRSNDSKNKAIENAARIKYNAMYEEYRRVRETQEKQRHSSNSNEGPSPGILKNNLEKVKIARDESKKKKIVQFVEDPIPINKEESTESEIPVIKRKKRSKPKVDDSSVEETLPEQVVVEQLPQTRKGRRHNRK